MSREDLDDLEALLARLPEEQRPAAAALVLAFEAAAETDIDVGAYGDDARAYLDSFPVHGRAVVNVLDVAAHWLARRIAMGEGAASRVTLAAALSRTLAGHEGDVPLVASAVETLVHAGPATGEAGEDPIWLGLARALVGDVAGITGPEG